MNLSGIAPRSSPSPESWWFRSFHITGELILEARAVTVFQNALTLSVANVRAVSLTGRVSTMLKARVTSNDTWLFPRAGKDTDSAFLSTSLDHQHSTTRAALGLPKDFVLHSLRHTF